MTRLRFCGAALLALTLALALTPTGRAQHRTHSSGMSGASMTLSATATASADRSYKVYSLDELGDDPALGEWVAQTIPEVIATGTWKGPGVIRYYAPKKILVVCHTPAVQAKVDEFLKDVKKSLPGPKKATAAAHHTSTHGHGVVPAAYQAPALLKTPAPAAEPGPSYPVPAQARPPKHLFHFIIRYEGDGLIDDSVVKAIKEYYRAEKKAAEAAATESGTLSGGAVSGSPTPPAATSAPKKAEEKKEDKKDKEEAEEES